MNPVEAIHVPLSKLQSLDLFEQVLAAPAKTDPLVQISSERSGLGLVFDSNRKTFCYPGNKDKENQIFSIEPGVQFYSAKFFDGKGTRKSIHGWSGQDGDGYGPHST